MTHKLTLLTALLPGMLGTGCFFGLQDFEGSLAGPDGCVTGFVERDGRCYRKPPISPPARDMLSGDTSPDMSPDMPGDMSPDMLLGDMSPDMPSDDMSGDMSGDMSNDADMGESDMMDLNTCINGVQDPGEIQVDCGGPCAACPSCEDGVQNQDEGGVDCGGSVCAGCMAAFPRSTFTMGRSSGSPDEFPAHSVTLSAFSIDETEVTIAAYRACVVAGACTEPETRFRGCNYDEPGREDHPVMCATWAQAVGYCEWVNKRLPTEAEWEFSAVGRQARTHPWGNQSVDCTRAILNEFNGDPAGCGAGSTAPVGSLPAGNTPDGVSDLLGNAAEWVNDWYDASYYQNSPMMDPQGPASGTEKVYRGSTYNSNINGINVRRRFSNDLGSSAVAGFRCAWSE